MKAPATARPPAAATRARRPAPAAPSARASKAARCRSTAACPKKGFNNAAFKTHYAVVNLDRLADHFDDGATINEATLREKKILKGRWRHKWDGIKILGEGDLAKKWTVEVDRVSESARQKIEAAGGSVTLIFRTLKDAADAKTAVETAAKAAAYAAKTAAS